MINTLRLLFLLLLSWSAAVAADEISICYNYGCAVTANIRITGKELVQIKKLFTQLPDAQAERDAIAQAIGLFEYFSGTQSPTFRDRGGNVNDDGEDGRMDCIDHSTNSTTYLHLLDEKGYLKFHKVLPRAKRAPYLFDEHWAAVIEEINTKHDFAVDSWFFDNGHPAAIFDFDKWKSGATPDA